VCVRVCVDGAFRHAERSDLRGIPAVFSARCNHTGVPATRILMWIILKFSG